jgi:hypothetical protein
MQDKPPDASHVVKKMSQPAPHGFQEGIKTNRDIAPGGMEIIIDLRQPSSRHLPRIKLEDCEY